jgi:very-short-patch-repair endonuclease
MPEQHNPPLPSRAREQARDLRSRSTDTERKLWYHLRAGRLNGFKFRRQHPLPPYIVDFYCDVARLVVELDGSQHTRNVDAQRTSRLEAKGLRILRFWDNDVLCNMEAVLESILTAVEDRTLSPTPLPKGEGLKNEGEP